MSSVSDDQKDSESFEKDLTLRPKSLDEYIGQENLKERLKVSIEAARGRGDPLSSICLSSPPGLGKTSLAYLVSKEMESSAHVIAAPSVQKVADLVEILVQIEEKDILVFDELHRLPIKVEETLYEVIEDFRINIKSSGKSIFTRKIPKFTFVGCTTKIGKVSAPLRDRFDIIHELQFYDIEDLMKLLHANAKKLEVDVDEESGIEEIANRSRGIPRVANKLLRRSRDYAQVNNNNRITYQLVVDALSKEGIDKEGLTEADRKYIRTLFSVYGGGPCGKNTLAKSLQVDPSTVEDDIEVYLLRKNFVMFTSRGRQLTSSGMKYALGE